MNNPKISVIVPVYNVEQYLPKCIDSVLAQVEQDFELLLIDDGSTDNSGKICDEYHEKDDRITVFHKKNGGVSSARNVGLDNAKGEWIFFLDSDDCIDENELTIPETYSDADVISKSVTYVYGVADGGRRIDTKNIDIKKDHVYSTDIDVWRVFFNSDPIIGNSVVGKLYKRGIIGAQRFDTEIKVLEDALYNLILASKIHKYVFNNSGVYYYIQRSNSLIYSVLLKTSFAGRIELSLRLQNIAEHLTARPIFVTFVLRTYLTWILRHNNIKFLGQESLISIQNFIEGIEKKDCILFTKEDFKTIKKVKRNLHLYLNWKALYGFVIFKESFMDLLHRLLRNHIFRKPKNILKKLFVKKPKFDFE